MVVLGGDAVSYERGNPARINFKSQILTILTPHPQVVLGEQHVTVVLGLLSDVSEAPPLTPLNTLHPAPCTLHPQPHTLNPQYSTLNLEL